ncbi:MAG: alpha/beta hydrolase [Gammaproteobacteria bacterium]|nr:alpha/beta hydrolase [Gammaproteobacteria bacterium]MCH9744254.1 alpha/beta hydrolase [Gammaproteobacteria bacterium]
MDNVILLHGIGRDQRIMHPLARRFQQLGYSAHNLSYASTEYPVEALADQIYQKIQSIQAQSEAPLHFVAHSLGGIIVRYMLQHYEIRRLGGVVMMGPPNHGSAVVDFLKDFKFYKKMYGPAGQQLVTGEDGIAASLPAADYPLAIIAGNRCVLQDYLFSWFLFKGEPNDGKVSVESTQLDGMQQHTVLPVCHPKMPYQKIVIQHATSFIGQIARKNLR